MDLVMKLLVALVVDAIGILHLQPEGRGERGGGEKEKQQIQ